MKVSEELLEAIWRACRNNKPKAIQLIRKELENSPSLNLDHDEARALHRIVTGKGCTVIIVCEEIG